MFEGLNIEMDFENFPPYINPNRPWLNYWPENVPKSIKYDPITFHDFVRYLSDIYPVNVAIYYVPEEKKYTYRELFFYADRIANALIDKFGVKKGDSVAIMSGNVPEFIFIILGISQTGASIIPVNPLLKDSEVEHIINEAGNVKCLFVHDKNFRVIKKVKRSVKIDHTIIFRNKEPKKDTINFEDFIQGASSKPPQIDIDPMNDIATLLFTGGTTGLPKGVMLSHDNLISDALGVIYLNIDTYEEWAGKEAMISVLPLCHTFGFEVLIVALAGGSMMILEGDFVPERIMQHIELFKVKNFTGVPLMYQLIISHPSFGKYDLSSITSSISGSAALPSEIAKKWEKGTDNIKVAQGYGLTEASPVTHMQTGWLPEIRPDSVGIPLLKTDAAIVNPETLDELPIGDVGELLIKGPQVMKGYWKHPEATERVIVKDGWLRTGDLARMSEDGYFYIEGRTKDMIKYKGYKVMPREVEDKLETHPAISQAGVIGIPDPESGENIRAFVVLEKEYEGKITEQEIIDWAKENIASYKYPRFVTIVGGIPRTIIGKIDRKALKKK